MGNGDPSVHGQGGFILVQIIEPLVAYLEQEAS
jgi:hypothetical protein